MSHSLLLLLLMATSPPWQTLKGESITLLMSVNSTHTWVTTASSKKVKVRSVLAVPKEYLSSLCSHFSSLPFRVCVCVCVVIREENSGVWIWASDPRCGRVHEGTSYPASSSATHHSEQGETSKEPITQLLFRHWHIQCGVTWLYLTLYRCMLPLCSLCLFLSLFLSFSRCSHVRL